MVGIKCNLCDWETIEKRSNVSSIENYKNMKRAKEILDIGLQMLSEQGKLGGVAWHT